MKLKFIVIVTAISIASMNYFAINTARAANGAVVYSYDALGRIISASYDTGVIILYVYDANGNRTQQTVYVNSATLCWDTTTACSPTNKIATWDQGLWGP